MRIAIALTLFVAGALPGTTARGQAATPTTDELTRIIAEGQYPAALQKIAAALQLKGPAARSVDRYELYMLKAECHLQTKATLMAVEAYANAAKEAKAEPARGVAAAHETIVKRSRAFAYTPKFKGSDGKPAAPIDLLNKDARKAAFAALLADEMAASEPRIKAAKIAKTLPPLFDGIKAVVALEGIEVAATGKTDRSTALLGEMQGQAKRLIAAALRTMTQRVNEIDKEANTFVEFFQEAYAPQTGTRIGPGGYGQGTTVPRIVRKRAYKKKGLTDPMTRDLREVTTTCDQLAPAVAMLAQNLKTDDKGFEPLVDEATRLRKDVDRLLDTDYQRVYDTLPKEK